MAEIVQAATIAFLDSEGRTTGSLSLFCPVGEPSISRLNEEEIDSGSEERIQIYEATKYEYVIEPPQFRVRLATGNGALRTSALPDRQNSGYLELGAYVGRLQLLLVSTEGEIVGAAAVEVCTKKLGYRDDLRSMIEEITDVAVELAFELRSPTTLRATPDPSTDTRVLYQQFAFLDGLLNSKSFKDAVYHITYRPHERLDGSITSKDIRQGFRPSAAGLRGIARGGSRFQVPAGHPLRSLSPTLPVTVPVRSSQRSEDNVENRFVRFALEEFSHFLGKLITQVGTPPAREHARLAKDADRLLSMLDGFLSSSLLSGLPPARRVPLESTVLQRKEGYREVLQAWLKFDLAARLVWEGADDIYSLGQRDVATLYEYWIFFRLLRVVSDLFVLDPNTPSALLEETGDRLGLKLKSGENVAFTGHTLVRDLRVNIRLDYNRTFLYRPLAEDSGSWTERMRPDYTITLWAGDEDEASASEAGRTVHVHFDAKYRVENIENLFGKEGATEGAEQAEGTDSSTYKRIDLLKMHAYRDAIRRSQGAYILYPGQVNRAWTGYHELLPGLGAFVMKPRQDSENVRRFLNDLIEHVVSDSAQKKVSEFLASTYAGKRGSLN